MASGSKSSCKMTGSQRKTIGDNHLKVTIAVLLFFAFCQGAFMPITASTLYRDSFNFMRNQLGSI